MTTPGDVNCDPRQQVDPRGPRFGAGVTTVVLALAIVLFRTPAGTGLLVWQGLVFGLGAFVGLQAQPYGIVFRTLIRPRLKPSPEMEDATPPRFAQLVGFIFVTVALLALAAGLPSVALAAVALALAAAFLNAAFAFCLGCEMYLLGRRALSRA